MELLTIPAVTAIVQAIKMAIEMDSKHVPILSLIIGILLALLLVDEVFKTQVIIGITVGLAASGLYSGSKTILIK